MKTLCSTLFLAAMLLLPALGQDKKLLLGAGSAPASQGGGALTRVNTDAVPDEDGNATFTLPNFVVSAGSNRLLLVFVATFNDGAVRTVSTLSVGSDSPSFVGGQNAEGFDARIEIWRVIAPTQGTVDISGTLSGSAQIVHVAAHYVTGVSQATPLGAFAFHSGTALPDISITPASDAGDLVFDMLIHFFDAQTPAPDASQTAHWNTGTGDYRSRGSSNAGTATSTTMLWDQTADFTAAALAGIAVKP